MYAAAVLSFRRREYIEVQKAFHVRCLRKEVATMNCGLC